MPTKKKGQRLDRPEAPEKQKSGVQANDRPAPLKYVLVPGPLLHPEHQALMGPALWVFLWLWREARLEEGKWGGEVRGGQAIRLEEIGRSLGITVRTVKRHLARLREAEYVETWLAGVGMEIMVFLWDPVKEAAAKEEERGQFCPPNNNYRGDKTVPSAEKDERGDNTVPSVMIHDGTILSPLEQKPPKTDDEQGEGGTILSPLGTPSDSPLGELDITRNSLSSGGDSLVCVSNEPTATREEPCNEAQVERERGGQKKPAAGNGESPGLLKARVLILRVEEWERPDLTRTLAFKLGRLSPGEVERAFDFVWRRHRHRNKGLDSPAAWWASMLARAADELYKAKQEDFKF